MSQRTYSDELRHHYDDYYRTTKSADSVGASRNEMVRAVSSFVLASEGQTTVLDVGSGRREIEGAVRRNSRGHYDMALRDKLNDTFMVSIDVADIPPRRLIAGRDKHVRGDNRQMPFGSESFDMTISNLSIDMLRRDEGEFEKALSEASRVTKIGGTVLFNYHGPTLFAKLSGFYGDSNGFLSGYYDGKATSDPFYKKEPEIRDDLTDVGIAALSISLRESPKAHEDDQWWQVVGQRVA